VPALHLARLDQTTPIAACGHEPGGA